MKFVNIANSNKQIVVDDEDYDRVMLFRWSTKNRGNCIVRNRQVGNIANFIMRTTGILYDHHDRNFLNNQKYNLRVSTLNQNRANYGKLNRFNQCTSKFKGVGWNNKAKKWQVRIARDKKRYTIGYFHEEKEAALAYNKAAIELHGEFAVLNKIED